MEKNKLTKEELKKIIDNKQKQVNDKKVINKTVCK